MVKVAAMWIANSAIYNNTITILRVSHLNQNTITILRVSHLQQHYYHT